MIAFSCSAQHLSIGLLIIFLSACSGGGNGGTDNNIGPTGTFTTIGGTLADETMTVSYTLPPAGEDVITMIPASYASDGRGNIITDWVTADKANNGVTYEIFYTRSQDGGESAGRKLEPFPHVNGR